MCVDVADGCVFMYVCMFLCMFVCVHILFMLIYNMYLRSSIYVHLSVIELFLYFLFCPIKYTQSLGKNLAPPVLRCVCVNVGVRVCVYVCVCVWMYACVDVDVCVRTFFKSD